MAKSVTKAEPAEREIEMAPLEPGEEALAERILGLERRIVLMEERIELVAYELKQAAGLPT